MSELEDMISRLLDDPKQMARLSDLASGLFSSAPSDAESASPLSGPADPELLSGLSRLMSGLNSADDKSGLVSALCHYLKPEHRSRLERAARISRLAHIAGVALEEYDHGHV